MTQPNVDSRSSSTQDQVRQRFEPGNEAAKQENGLIFTKSSRKLVIPLSQSSALDSTMGIISLQGDLMSILNSLNGFLARPRTDLALLKDAEIKVYQCVFDETSNASTNGDDGAENNNDRHVKDEVDFSSAEKPLVPVTQSQTSALTTTKTTNSAIKEDSKNTERLASPEGPKNAAASSKMPDKVSTSNQAKCWEKLKQDQWAKGKILPWERQEALEAGFVAAETAQAADSITAPNKGLHQSASKKRKQNNASVDEHADQAEKRHRQAFAAAILRHVNGENSSPENGTSGDAKKSSAKKSQEKDSRGLRGAKPANR